MSPAHHDLSRLCGCTTSTPHNARVRSHSRHSLKPGECSADRTPYAPGKPANFLVNDQLVWWNDETSTFPNFDVVWIRGHQNQLKWLKYLNGFKKGNRNEKRDQNLKLSPHVSTIALIFEVQTWRSGDHQRRQDMIVWCVGHGLKMLCMIQVMLKQHVVPLTHGLPENYPPCRRGIAEFQVGSPEPQKSTLSLDRWPNKVLIGMEMIGNSRMANVQF